MEAAPDFGWSHPLDHESGNWSRQGHGSSTEVSSMSVEISDHCRFPDLVEVCPQATPEAQGQVVVQPWFGIKVNDVMNGIKMSSDNTTSGCGTPSDIKGARILMPDVTVCIELPMLPGGIGLPDLDHYSGAGPPKFNRSSAMG